MLQGYVINLDRHPDRLFAFYQQPDTHLFQRIPAVDKQILALLGNGDLLFDIARIEQKINRPITLGEIGCTLSHIKAWKAIANNVQLTDQDFALVAEDDVKLIGNFHLLIESLIQSISEQPIDLVILQKLGLYSHHIAIFDGGILTYSNPISPIHCDNDGSALYLIRKQKAKLLVDELSRCKPDWLADQFSSFCELNRIAVLSHQFGYISDDNESDLETERNLARQYLK